VACTERGESYQSANNLAALGFSLTRDIGVVEQRLKVREEEGLMLPSIRAVAHEIS